MTLQQTDPSSQLQKIQRWGLTAGLIGTALCALGYSANHERFFESYLLAYVFWVNISLGSLGLVMLHHMTSGKWGYAVQRYAEAGARTILLMAFLFLPVIAGMSGLYPWMHPDHLQEGAVRKLPYLNQTFFLARAGFYFALWVVMSFVLTRWSRRQDASGDARLTVILRRLSAPGLILYVLSVTFASTDWVMSLEPDWFSTIYGFIFVVSQVLAALSLCVIMLRYFSKSRAVAEVAGPGVFLDLGNLMLAFVVLWAYVSFSQLLITWAGNLPEEITWYVRRLDPAWRMVALVLVILHFFVPFTILLIRRSKRSATILWKVALGLLVMRLVDVYWLIIPAFEPNRLAVDWLDLAAMLAIGGFWMMMFGRLMHGASLVPSRDPRFAILPETATGASHG
ncbi:MAG: hypothetical protein WB699_11965 [Bacteroidota bacterium]